MKYSEIVNRNRQLADKVKSAPYHIGVLNNVTINNLVDILEYTLRIKNVNAVVSLGNYDNIIQDSRRLSNSSAVIIFWEIANVMPGAYYNIELLSDSGFDALYKKLLSEIDIVLDVLKEVPLVLFNKFTALPFTNYFINEKKIDRLCKNLNEYIEQKKYANLKLIETEKLFAKISIEKAVDFRNYYLYKALYSNLYFIEWSNYVRPIFMSILGLSKKALYLDCDNTLWGGILGETGFDNIKMSSEDSTGSIFEEAQALYKELANRGVIIGLCSKNNERDVDQVLNSHKDMLLKDKDIAIKRVNWNNKVNNINDMTGDLNIGSDAVVYIDDSDFEINFVKDKIKDITAIKVPVQLYNYPILIRENMELFYNFSMTEEDFSKIKMYKEQKKREHAKPEFTDIESYLNSLGLVLTICIDSCEYLKRIAQITQKTNQFNLTTKRYSETEIERFLHDESYKVFSFSLKDNFGNYGITGLSIIQINKQDQAELVIFLMSCRIIGRNVEYAFFNEIVDILKKRGVKVLKGNYIKTDKNSLVEKLLDKFGFEWGGKGYYLIMNKFIPKKVDYIKVNIL